MITWKQTDSPTYAQVIDLVATMVCDRDAQALARERGLHIVDVTWEDTGQAAAAPSSWQALSAALQLRSGGYYAMSQLPTSL